MGSGQSLQARTGGVCAALMVLCASPVLAADPVLDWTRTYGGAPDAWDYGTSVAAANDGSVFAGGWIHEPGRGRSFRLLKYSDSGRRLWSRTHDRSPRFNFDYTAALDVLADGSVRVATKNSDAGLVVGWFDGDGAILARPVVIEVSHRIDTMAFTPSGEVCAAGLDTSGHVVLTCFGQNGTLARSWTSTGAWSRVGHVQLAFAADQSAYLAWENAPYYWTSSSIFVVKISGTGEVVWERSFGALTGAWVSASDLAVAPDGSLLVVGSLYRRKIFREHAVVIKVAADGTRSWCRTYRPPWGRARAAAVAAGPSGEVYVTGWSQGPSRPRDVLVQQFDAGGTLLWSSTWDGEYGRGDEGSAVAVARDGAICLVGTAAVTIAGRDILVQKYFRWSDAEAAAPGRHDASSPR